MPIAASLHTKHTILHNILSGSWPAGTPLPPERELATILEVTRPTLREILKFLEYQGWITIRHGKSSVVNDIWEKGGLGILSTLARYPDFIPLSLITELLELRRQILPPCARIAAQRSPKCLDILLSTEALPPDDPKAFSEFDWKIQEILIRASGKRTTLLVYNDFRDLFRTGGTLYFEAPDIRNQSLRYYATLRSLFPHDPEAVEKCVSAAMENSLLYWQTLFPSNTPVPDFDTAEIKDPNFVP